MNFKLKLICCCLNDWINTFTDKESDTTKHFVSNGKRMLNYHIGNKEFTAEKYAEDKRFIYLCFFDYLHLIEQNYTGGFLDPIIKNENLLRLFKSYIYHECLKIIPHITYGESYPVDENTWTSELFISLQNITNDYFVKNLSHS
jgi:hypothetical protein